jgi:hypothetical protein
MPEPSKKAAATGRAFKTNSRQMRPEINRPCLLGQGLVMTQLIPIATHKNPAHVMMQKPDRLDSGQILLTSADDEMGLGWRIGATDVNPKYY